MLLIRYDTREALHAAIGCRLDFKETSIFGREYLRNGTFLVAHRPILQGRTGKEFFAKVTMRDDLILSVE